MNVQGAGATADVRLLLAHQPITAPAGAQAGWHLALHGHTPGGQWCPWNHAAAPHCASTEDGRTERRLRQPLYRWKSPAASG